MSKVLVVCFSRSGTTRALGAKVAERLHADFEEIAEASNRSGVWGFARSLADAVFKRDVHINPLQHDVARYEIVVIGTPVWAGTASAPVRAWLASDRRKLPHVAFFCTQNARGDIATFADMAKLVGKRPVARCTVSRDFSVDDERRVVDMFVDRIERRLARIADFEWAA